MRPRPLLPALEFTQRRARLDRLLNELGADGFLINSESNHRYLTGHWSGRWTSRTRPIFLLLKPGARPRIVCSVVEEQTARMSTPDCDVIVFGGSAFNLEPALETLAGEIEKMGLAGGSLAAEFGLHHRPQIPPGGFEALRARLPNLRLVDGSRLLWQLRVEKSPGEVALIQEAIDITEAMFRDLPGWLPAARTEREVFNRICQELLRLGADQVGYINVLHDTTAELGGGYTDRALKKDDAVIYIDAGCIVDGYWSDYARMFCLGKPSPQAQAAYEQLWTVVENAIGAVRPGLTISSLYHRMLTDLQAAVATTPMLGRVGHSMGLEIIEPPSICPEDETPLRPGMILNIEPSLRTPDVGTLIAEEIVVVTESGCRLLTQRAPNAIPVIHG